jgi:hypothetical protein
MSRRISQPIPNYLSKSEMIIEGRALAGHSANTSCVKPARHRSALIRCPSARLRSMPTLRAGGRARIPANTW